MELLVLSSGRVFEKTLNDHFFVREHISGSVLDSGPEIEGFILDSSVDAGMRIQFLDGSVEEVVLVKKEAAADLFLILHEKFIKNTSYKIRQSDALLSIESVVRGDWGVYLANIGKTYIIIFAEFKGEPSIPIAEEFMRGVDLEKYHVEGIEIDKDQNMLTVYPDIPLGDLLIF